MLEYAQKPYSFRPVCDLCSQNRIINKNVCQQQNHRDLLWQHGHERDMEKSDFCVVNFSVFNTSTNPQQLLGHSPSQQLL